MGGTDYDIQKFKQKTKYLNNILIFCHKPYDQIPSLLKAADILVLPNSAKEEISNRYTSPLKLFEYMASGRPIVASSLPSITEILNSKNAVLVKPDDVRSLMEGVIKLLDDSLFGFELAKKGLEDVQDYTWQNRAVLVLNFLS